MELEITEQVDNPLFDRKDVRFVMWHDGESTPSRRKIRELVAGKIGTPSDAVIVDHMESASGMAATRGLARAYGSLDDAKKHERKHFIARNSSEASAGEGGDETPAEAKAPAEAATEEPAVEEAAAAPAEAEEAGEEAKDGDGE